jgi:hypothetical protein
MNAQVLQLFRQAGGTVSVSENAILTYTDHFDVEKFAKLIVEECVSTVENLSPGYQDYRNQIEDAFRRDCVEQIKQHFGVTE